MDKPRTIDATQAREKVQRGQAALVCAYDDEAKCARMLLDGAISLAVLRASAAEWSRADEIIFYCA
jgi:hypothetical protein